MQHSTRLVAASGMDPPPDATPGAELCQDVECGLCTGMGRDDGVGLCPVCQTRVPRVGGCGASLWLVAAIAGEGETEAPLAHLVCCPACRTFFEVLAALTWCAHQEALAQQNEAPHAAVLAGETA